MKVQVDRLRQALKIVEPAVATKSTLPATKSVLVGQGQVMATNLEVSVKTELPEATELMLAPYEPLIQVLARTPGYLTATIQVSKGKVELTAGGSKTTLPAGDPKDFPPMPGLDGEGHFIDADVLIGGMAAVADYTAKEESRPVLMAVCIELGNPVEMVGADGFRLGIHTTRTSFPVEGSQRLLVPAKSVRLIEKVWKRMSGGPGYSSAPEGTDVVVQGVSARRLVRLSYNKGQMALESRGTTILTQLIEGNFPNYRELVPADLPHKVRFMADEMEQELQRLAPVAHEGAGVARFTWDDGELLTVAARGGDMASEGQVWAQVEGGSGKIAFNISYLLSYLKGRQGMVTMECGQPGSAALFVGRGPRVVMMPMAVRWDGEEAPEPEPEDKVGIS